MNDFIIAVIDADGNVHCSINTSFVFQVMSKSLVMGRSLKKVNVVVFILPLILDISF